MTDLEATVQRVQNSVIDARVLGANDLIKILIQALKALDETNISIYTTAQVTAILDASLREYELMMLRKKK